MKNFDNVGTMFGDLEYMDHAQAVLMRDLIIKHDAQDILEIGFMHGKSSAYIAAILEDLGHGHLVTIDRETARKREPNIEQVLAALNLTHRVTPIYAHRSYTWEMAKMIRENPRPQFDFCYFDGGHTWDGTGFGFVLVDVLLRPGGWIVFDDIPWTIEHALQIVPKPPKHWLTLGPQERTTPAVKMVFEQLAPHLGYTHRRIVNNGQWGIARKPLERSGNRVPAGGVLGRFVEALAKRQSRQRGIQPGSTE